MSIWNRIISILTTNKFAFLKKMALVLLFDCIFRNTQDEMRINIISVTVFPLKRIILSWTQSSFSMKVLNFQLRIFVVSSKREKKSITISERLEKDEVPSSKTWTKKLGYSKTSCLKEKKTGSSQNCELHKYEVIWRLECAL